MFFLLLQLLFLFFLKLKADTFIILIIVPPFVSFCYHFYSFFSFSLLLPKSSFRDGALFGQTGILPDKKNWGGEKKKKERKIEKKKERRKKEKRMIRALPFLATGTPPLNGFLTDQ